MSKLQGLLDIGHKVIPYKGDKPENILKWAEALESGKYPQGKLRLKNNRGEFCCLGVACDISNLGSWSNTGRYTDFAYGLSPAVSQFLGFKNADDIDLLTCNGVTLTGITLNDNYDLSFNEIAWLLRESLK